MDKFEHERDSSQKAGNAQFTFAKTPQTKIIIFQKTKSWISNLCEESFVENK